MIYVNEHITLEDIDLIEAIISGTSSILTEGQKISADISSEGSINQYDLSILQTLISQSGWGLGDVDGDGSINVADIVALISYILGNIQPTEAQLLAADINEDGIVNVADLTAIINIILGE